MGRRSLLTEVKQRLAESHAVTLTGAGGIGKSRVAWRVMDDERATYRDGSWTVDLTSVMETELVLPAVAEAIGIRADVAAEHADLLVDFLAERKALLVLDGCERTIDAVADLVLRLRQDCPELRILATSRQRLGISGEAVILVMPLTVPDPEGPIAPDGLLQFESVTLFVDRASLASADFRLSSDNAEPVAELCVALEGIPLAIELAATRIGTLSPRAMLRQLTDRYGLLEGGYRDAPDRHRSLRSCVDWSFDMCTEQEQVLWCRMSVFTGGSDLADAIEVCAGAGLDADDILPLIGALVDKSIVEVTHAPDGTNRYVLLESVALYGRERLREASILAEWERRHAQWCALLAAGFRLDWVGDRQAELLHRLRWEHGNLRAALAYYATDPSDPRAGLVMTTDLDSYWVTSGLASEARHWLEVGLARAAGSPAERALAMVLAARYAWLQRDRASVRRWLEQAEPEVHESGDRRALGLLSLLTALVAVWDEEFAAAVVAALESVRLLEEQDDVASRLVALSVAGICLGFAGDREGAIAAHERAIALAEEVGETFRRSFSLAGLGELALAAGEVERAGDLFAQALRIRAELGDRMGVAVCLDSLGRVATAEAQGSRAALLLGAAQSIWDAIGMHETRNPLAMKGLTAEGIHQARRLLGKQAFRAEYRRGAALSEERAVSYALNEDLDVDAEAPELDPSPLTRRETEVAALVGEGCSNPEIAERLVISVRTAQGHVENILRKLGFTSRSMIAAWVAQREAQARALAENASSARG